MAGNVWEWTDSVWQENIETRVLRGGSWDDGSGDAACSCRNDGHPHDRDDYLGFRCART
jgi:formylglycine-generating enzyme required for sulfatase activity